MQSVSSNLIQKTFQIRTVLRSQLRKVISILIIIIFSSTVYCRIQLFISFSRFARLSTLTFCSERCLLLLFPFALMKTRFDEKHFPNLMHFCAQDTVLIFKHLCDTLFQKLKRIKSYVILYKSSNMNHKYNKIIE